MAIFTQFLFKYHWDGPRTKTAARKQLRDWNLCECVTFVFSWSMILIDLNSSKFVWWPDRFIEQKRNAIQLHKLYGLLMMVNDDPWWLIIINDFCWPWDPVFLNAFLDFLSEYSFRFQLILFSFYNLLNSGICCPDAASSWLGSTSGCPDASNGCLETRNGRPDA